ncbi:hypothetical protein [Geothrix sp. 21YS21S-2]|uniref:hypothetical protein n=1 Tax=Geothrix sp. 21YS21S-2 TaxID=3068893 RepID=UPI0027B96122|nr:hypothetical protein [Geothrix sp. 21YS21S-2]
MPMREGWLMLCLATAWMFQPQRADAPPWTALRPAAPQRPVALTQEGPPPRPGKPGEAYRLVRPGQPEPPRGLPGLPAGFRF